MNSKRRRAGAKPRLLNDDDERIAETVAFTPPTPQGITEEEVLHALRNLPSQFQEVVVFADVEDMTYKEIADVLSVPVGTVMSRLSRGGANFCAPNWQPTPTVMESVNRTTRVHSLFQRGKEGNQMQCRDFREIADSYLSDELLIETNHDVISHLQDCAECRREMTARRELRAKLRAAFLSAPEAQMRPDFAHRLRAQLHDYGMQRGPRAAAPGEWRSSLTLRRASWLALAACLLIAAGFGLVLVRQRIYERLQEAAQQRKQESTEVASHEPTTNHSPETGPGLPVNLVKTELAKSAVGDHRNCAIHFRLQGRPIDLEEAGRKYDPVYINLTKAVLSRDGEPAQAQLVEAHSCVFEERRFAHIVLRYHGRLVSFLVTDVDRANETQATATRTLTDPQTQVIACSQFGGYRVSCFKTARHAVFIVSDLPEGGNLALARAIAPSVLSTSRALKTGLKDKLNRRFLESLATLGAVCRS